MRVEISGRNYNVSRVISDFTRELKKMGLNHTKSYSGGGHAQSKAHARFYIDGATHDLCKLLEDSSVHIEAVEETPGVIFKYVSPIGAKTFRSKVEFQEIDTNFFEYEDEEAYCERMGKVGILV